MIREWLVDFYLFLFKIQFGLCQLFSLKEKITFVVSYSENSKYVYEEMQREHLKTDVVFLCRGNCIKTFQNSGRKAIPFETMNLFYMFRACFHLATSKVVVVDNYFGFLAAVHFKKQVECIQLWHAAGAFKTFGLQDHSIAARTKQARERFMKVYQQFDKVAVGSDIMAEIFKIAFGLSEANILRTGIPRTDLFYDNRERKRIASDFKRKFKNKKIILYAPTFRDGHLDDFRLPLNLSLLKEKLSNDFVILLRLHPAVHSALKVDQSDFVFDYSAWPNINELLLVADVLVTDYSSTPFEFALLNRPMIFFAYDLEEYQDQRGLWGDYANLVPGPIVRTTEEMIACLQGKNAFDMDEISDFSAKWNKYSLGNSSENVVRYISNRLYSIEKNKFVTANHQDDDSNQGFERGK